LGSNRQKVRSRNKKMGRIQIITDLEGKRMEERSNGFFHPGLVEELCFRGFLETRLERLFSVKKALIIQATIFGLYHLPQVISGNPGWLVIGGLFYPLIAFVGGVIMGIIHIKTRNLFVGIGFHASLLEFFLLSSILAT